jgi:hypothetical protein
MQTFLPLPDFRESARCLDYRRLGKQRVEVLQLARSHLGTTGWSHHPASVMWSGHTVALIQYGLQVCNEWRERGYQDTCGLQLEELMYQLDCTKPWDVPWWIGNEAFHASHRSNLLRKDAHWYGRFGWSEPNDLPYVWPTGGPA